MDEVIKLDETVKSEDARPAGKPDECFYCRSAMGTPHRADCVIMDGRRFDALPGDQWLPISDYIDGNHVIFWFPEGEKGIGGQETAMAFRDGDGVIRHGWTHGGPNSGADFDFHEPPTLWHKLPEPPLDRIKDQSHEL